MKREQLALILLVLGIIFINYGLIDGFLVKNFDNVETGTVERVIDGDTIVVNGSHIRMLGINTPEKGEPFSSNATSFLEEQVLGKKVTLKFGKEKYDLYKRKLSYVFVGRENINKEIIENGYANFYFPKGEDLYSKELREAWSACLDSGKNLCEKSGESCIVLQDWDIKEQKVVLRNICSNSVDISGWSVKDEGRKIYFFENEILDSGEEVILIPEDFGKTYVWTETGDTIFIRDAENKLVYWENY
jgi:hypothetical protein